MRNSLRQRGHKTADIGVPEAPGRACGAAEVRQPLTPGGVLTRTISGVRDRTPYGYVCEIMVPVQGLSAKHDRTVEVTTAWIRDSADTRPRLVNAYIRS